MASVYANELDKILGEMCLVDANETRLAGLSNIMKMAAELAFMINCQQAQYNFVLPELGTQKNLRFQDDFMENDAGISCPDCEGKPVGLIVWPAIVKYGIDSTDTVRPENQKGSCTGRV